jgi:hypothetical protein
MLRVVFVIAGRRLFELRNEYVLCDRRAKTDSCVADLANQAHSVFGDASDDGILTESHFP